MSAMLLRGSGLRYAYLAGLVMCLAGHVFAAPRAVRVALHDAHPVAFQEDGQARGFLIELLEQIAERESWQLEYAYGTWKEGLDRVERGELDLIFPILYTPERDELFDFNTVQAFETWGVVFAHRSLGVQSLGGLSDQRIGYIGGDYFGDRFRAVLEALKIEPALLHRFDTPELLFAAARRGEIDAFPFESVAGRKAAVQHSFAPTPLVFESAAPLFATRQGRNADLLDAIDLHMRHFKATPGSGYVEAYEAWFTPPPVVPRWLWPGAVVAAGLIVAFSGFSVMLRRQVASRTAELQHRNQQLEEQIAARLQAEQQRGALQQQLHRSERLEAMGVLSAGMAHDFNNLLMAISANLDALPTDEGEGGPRAAIADAVQQASGLTRSLLTFGGRSEAEKLPLDLVRVVGDAQRLLRRMLPEQVEIDLDLDPEQEAWIEGDEIGLQQVLLNLAVNARDAMPTGGRLQLRVRGPDPGCSAERLATLEVIDNGIGMTPQQRARAFEPFFTTKPRGKGTGLGLAIAHGVVSDHGGQISIHPAATTGTRIRVELPGIPAPQDAPEAVSADHPARVLVADMQQATREMLASFLGEQGYEVSQCDGGPSLQAALSREAGQVDLVVMDSELPGLSGRQVLRDEREAGRSTAVILMSGSLNLEAGAIGDRRVGLLIKPFRLPALGKLAQTLLREEAE